METKKTIWLTPKQLNDAKRATELLQQIVAKYHWDLDLGAPPSVERNTVEFLKQIDRFWNIKK